eukprot:1126708-Rhodomonas_salina.1
MACGVRSIGGVTELLSPWEASNMAVFRAINEVRFWLFFGLRLSLASPSWSLATKNNPTDKALLRSTTERVPNLTMESLPRVGTNAMLRCPAHHCTCERMSTDEHEH